ncbi:CaiB/BaiF CoA transferase family protein [Dactylosporangium sucinum]|uniref:Formyl-CoA transferase n=1 Tax=Dactylosporangium sucinum TaxID=1424081 RepID=A0A917UCY8_9ACTN|nr:CoA transferase [Dactylosporangium sucinum]GGM76157.1 formyl-CoA transferase [Dactylosporangium sucinum]
MSEGPLHGVRVLCVDNYLAGNYGAMLLALHGADVVKVETRSGEAMRGSRPLIRSGVDEEWSHFALRMMRGKGSIALDIDGTAEDRAAFEGLVRRADVFWTNLRPPSAVRRKVDAASLMDLNPRLVYVTVTGFGLPENGEGEYSGMPAFDILVQGLAGLLDRNADEQGRPTYNGLPIADQVASLYGAFGALLGLRQRDRTGAGCVVDVPMFDSMVSLNEKAISMYGMLGEVPPPRLSATTAPFGLYRAADGWVCIAVGSDAVWRRFGAAVGEHIGRPGLADDDALRIGTERVRRLDEVTVVVEAFTRERAAADVVEFLIAHDVPAGLPLEVDRLMGTAQVEQRGIVRRLTLDSGVAVPVVMSPVSISGTRQQVDLPPHLDEDRDRLLDGWRPRGQQSR